jgi:branched-chain amino acid transport system substrate-binding protein
MTMLRKLLTATSLAAAVLSMACPAGDARAQISGDVVRIGVLNDQSTVFAANGGMGSVVAARLAAEDFGGTVLGKKIEIVFADHQNKADIAGATARRWIDNEGMDMIADGASSAAGLAIQQVTRDKKRIFVITGSATTELTGKACSPYGFHFNYDTYALANGTGRALAQQGGDTWYFITADYAFGHALERDTSGFVREGGGRVLGSVRHPLNTTDFSSFLLQAQASRAKVIGLATSGDDLSNVVKQAAEFGIVRRGQRLAGLLIFISNVEALGLEVAQGLTLTTSFYWDLDDRTREWQRRFGAAHGGHPATMIHAGTYSGVRHYLRAVEAAGTDDPDKVAEQMRRMPVEDMYNHGVAIRPDGRVLHDMYLAEVKKPSESQGRNDFYRILRRIPGEQAYLPLERSECPLVTRR